MMGPFFLQVSSQMFQFKILEEIHRIDSEARMLHINCAIPPGVQSQLFWTDTVISMLPPGVHMTAEHNNRRKNMLIVAKLSKTHTLKISTSTKRCLQSANNVVWAISCIMIHY